MDISLVGAPVEDFHTLGSGGGKLSQLLKLPLDQSLLVVAVIDAQPHVLTVAFQASVTEDRPYDDLSATRGQTHGLLDFPRYYPLAEGKGGLHRYKPNLLEQSPAQGPFIRADIEVPNLLAAMNAQRR